MCVNMLSLVPEKKIIALDVSRCEAFHAPRERQGKQFYVGIFYGTLLAR